MTRRVAVRFAVSVAILSGVAVSTAACGDAGQDPISWSLGIPQVTQTPTPKPTPSPETKTPNLDSGFSTYWILLPGGKEKVLCFERTYDGDPSHNHANGVAASCDWDHKQPVTAGGGK